MNPIRVTVIVERIEWVTVDGQALTQSSISATSYRGRDVVEITDGAARMDLSAAIDEAASKAVTMAISAKLWEADQ